MKIIVYAIAKNEEKFVDRWVKSMKEADAIYVLDTGSTDKTVSKLKEQGVIVEQEKIEPWRFDVARNKSLDLVPLDVDICVCTDLDEVLEPGWREELENKWQPQTTRARYHYNWSLDENNKPLVSFDIEKIHARKNFIWTHPVHETLKYLAGQEQTIKVDKVVLNHYPDLNKSRSSYLPLLELSVKEDPNDDRNMHYLGREYMYYQRYPECIETLKKHLALKTATWADERCASMRFIARSYSELNQVDEAITWYQKAVKEAPDLRDSYVELAILYYKLQNWEQVIYYCDEALKIKTKSESYINEIFSWDYTVYDLKSLAYYYLGNKDEALKNIDIALTYAKEDERLLNNKKFMMEN